MTKRAATMMATGLAALGLVAAGCGSDGGGKVATPEIVVPTGRYAPQIDPADFGGEIDNPYMPLAPGMAWDYKGRSEGVTETNHVEVTDQRRTIMGIPAVVVRDTVRADGEVTEDTYDWFAQDKAGNVWYLGEDTKEYEGAKVTSTKGSWEAGVDGAQPGIVMPAHPEVGRTYRQEYLAGEAEDMAEVTKVGTTRTVPLGDYTDVVETKEWTPLEPDLVEAKYYAPGVGFIDETTLKGGHETSKLVAFSGGSGARP